MLTVVILDASPPPSEDPGVPFLLSGRESCGRKNEGNVAKGGISRPRTDDSIITRSV